MSWRQSQTIQVLVVLIAASKAPAQVEWTAQEGCALTNPTLSGFLGPEVMVQEGEHHMWYANTDGELCTGHVAYASSQDGGCTWQPSGAPVLEATFDWETDRVGNPAILFDGEKYLMWYRASNPCVGGEARLSNIGYAVSLSQDPLQWTRSLDAPVLTGDADWETGRVANPTVLFDGTIHRMWYDGGSGSRAIGYATSPDGVTWTKCDRNPVLHVADMIAPTVVFDAATGSFEMWFHDGETRWLGYATSMEGISWSYSGLFPVGGEKRIAQPSVLFDASGYQLWYTALGGSEIHHATAPWSLPKASFSVDGAFLTDDGTGLMITSGTAPLVVTVNAAKSASPDPRGIASYEWTFGDPGGAGNTTTGVQAEHTYESPGEYRITLVVTDAAGNTGSVARCVRVLAPPPSQFLRGDCNGDGAFDISHGISNLNALFGNGKASDCLEACNTNNDDKNDISDAVAVFNYLFASGAPPASPYPDCGEDPEPAASLGCGRFGCE